MSNAGYLDYIIRLKGNLGEQAQRQMNTLKRANEGARTSVDRLGQSHATLEQRAVKSQNAMMRAINNATKASQRQLGFLERMGTVYDRLGRGAKAFGAVAGGVAAGGAVAAMQLQKPLAYDLALRYAANTAYSERDKDGRKAGMVELDALVNKTVRSYGGTREGALGGYNKLIGSGQFSSESAGNLLPALQKSAVAANVEIEGLAEMAERMKVSMGIADADIPLAISKVMRAGEMGGFELKESSPWMARLWPRMKEMGYNGMDGVETLSAMLQQARATAGTNDEAGNNVLNLLAKATSKSTTKDFEKQKIDLPAEMAKGRALGQDPLTVYMAQMDKVIAKQDPSGKALATINRIGSIKDPVQREAAMGEARKVYETAGVGEIISDLQEMSAFLALRSTVKYGQEVRAGVKADSGQTVDTAFALVNDGAGASLQKVDNEWKTGVQGAFNGISEQLKSASDAISTNAQEYPKLTTAIAGTTIALTTLAAMLGGFGLMAKMGGLFKGGGAAAGAAGAARGAALVWPTLPGAAAGAAGAAGAASRGGMLAGALGRWLPAIGVGTWAYEQRDPNSAMNQLKARSDSLLSQTTKGKTGAPLAAAQKVDIGQGQLAVTVRVQDERVLTAASVTQQPSNLKINAGATNPQGSW